ncbi:MAG TPA: MFS transporter [Actinomycetota bacterium]|nr:MFS transporter [Actinomycetota bacterium]
MDTEPRPMPPPDAATRSSGSTFGLLRRNPDFRKLYSAVLISFGGDWFTSVALLSLVLETTGSATLAGLVLAAQTLPFAIVSPFAGVIVDRIDRRTVMIAADVIRAVLALGLLAARSEETIWIAFVILTLLSGVSAFFEPASSAALPNVVAKEDLARANVLMGSAWGTMLVVGAALGGLVSSTLGNDAAFIGDSASFVVSAMLLLRVRASFHERAPSRDHSITIVDDVRETIRFARRERHVLALLTVKAGFGLSAGVIGLIAVFAVKVFDGGDATIGFLMSARGAGALIGPFIFRRWARERDERLFLGLTIAGLIFGAGYMLFAVAPNAGIAAIGAAIAHVGGGSTWTLSTYGLQRWTPDAIRGRVFSFDYGLVTLTIAASVFIAGLVADSVDPRIVAFGIACVAIGWVLGWTVWRRKLLRIKA